MTTRIHSYCAHLFPVNRALSLIKLKEPLSVTEDPESQLLENLISKKSKQQKAQTLELMGRSGCKSESTSRSIFHEHLPRQRLSNADNIRSIHFLKQGHTKVQDIHKNKSFHSRPEWEVRLMKSKIQEVALLNKDAETFEVFSKGTKFMKSINFPTVIIKLPSRTLCKSTVYYVILEPRQKSPTGSVNEKYYKIPGVLFSNPDGQKLTRFAELLPLCFYKRSNSVCFTPMLGKKRCRHVFRRGCSFKVKWLIPDRAFSRSREHSWNKYDLRSKEMRNMLTRFIEYDIRQLSLLMTKTVIQLKLKTKHHSGLRKGSSSGRIKLHTSENVNTEKKETPHEIASRKFQTFCRSYEPVNGGRGSLISAGYSNVSPSNTSSSWDIRTTFKWHSNNNLDGSSKYRCISRIL